MNQLTLKFEEINWAMPALWDIEVRGPQSQAHSGQLSNLDDLVSK